MNEERESAAIAARLRSDGVTISRPETCLIDPEVEVAADTLIEPFVQLLGRTRMQRLPHPFLLRD